MSDLEPSGFKCSQCHKYHKFGIWVAAHWNEVLLHKCDCGAIHRIYKGAAAFIRTGAKL